MSATTIPIAPTFHPVLRAVAQVISYVFHPLFIPVYVNGFMLYNMIDFSSYQPMDKIRLMAFFFVNYTLFPLVTVLLLKALRFIDSVFLRSRRDRILPYVACEIYYFWAWYVARNNHYHNLVVLFALGIFLATSLGLILNSYIKISMHMISLGVVSAFALMVAFSTSMSFGPYLSIALITAGGVATARLIVSDHTPGEVYAGFFCGAITQAIAYFFV